MQAVFGTRSENLKTDMEEHMRSGGGRVGAVTSATHEAVRVPAVVTTPGHRARATAVVAGLGGAGNLLGVEPCALTRVRLELADPDAIDERTLERAGVAGVWRLDGGIVHLIVGEDAGGIAAALAELRAPDRTPTRGQS